MMSSEPQFLDDLLQACCLYASAEIQAQLLHSASGTEGLIKVPLTIPLYCRGGSCANVMAWDISGGEDNASLYVSPDHITCHSVEYVCRHCREAWIRFELTLQRSGESK